MYRDDDRESIHRVGLVEDHASVAIGLSVMLATTTDLTLTADAPTVAELLSTTTNLDVVILDLRLYGGSNPAGDVCLLRRHGIEVLGFADADDLYLMRTAVRAGVLGIVGTCAETAAVVDAVRRVAAGHSVATPEWTSVIDTDPGLSPRLQQILGLYASGESAQRVAQLTGLSKPTVHDHITRIRLLYARAGRAAPTKTDLYKRAVEDGWLPRPAARDRR